MGDGRWAMGDGKGDYRAMRIAVVANVRHGSCAAMLGPVSGNAPRLSPIAYRLSPIACLLYLRFSTFTIANPSAVRRGSPFHACP